MADFYVDHGVYGGTNRIGIDTPTWGVPQEGDGSATSAATSSSVAEIQLTADAVASETLTIAGATITAAAAAGANQFARGGSIAATVTNIITLLNSANATATVNVGTSPSVGGSATGVTSTANQLRNMFYARLKPATTDTIQIMSRIGSTRMNFATNSSVQITSGGGWSAGPVITQFTGGTGGCWGWLYNDVALGQGSSIAARSYGLLTHTPTVWTAAVTNQDIVWVRTGSGQTIDLGTLPNNTTLTRSTSLFDLNLYFDTNIKWTGDSGTGVVTLKHKLSTSGGGTTLFFGNGSVSTFINCVLAGNFTIYSDQTAGASAAQFSIGVPSGSNGMMTLQRVKFDEATAGVSASIQFTGPGGGSTQYMRLLSCIFNWQAASRLRLPSTGLFAFDSTTNNFLEVDDCDFTNMNLTGSPATNNPLFGNPSTYGTYGRTIKFTRNKFSTYAGSKLKCFTGTLASTAAPIQFVIHGNNNLELNAGATAIGLQNAFSYTRPAWNLNLSLIGEDQTRWQRIEWQNGIAEWNPGASPAQPYLAATMPDGTPYSVALTWLATSSLSPQSPFVYRSTMMNRISASSDTGFGVGKRQIKTEFLIPPSTTVDKTNFGVTVYYVDSNGVPRAERTHGVTDPASSSASWQPPALIAASYSTHSTKKMTVTTSYAVKQYTEVMVEVALCLPLPAAGGSKVIFFDPEFSIT